MELRHILGETVCALADNGTENAAFEARELLAAAGVERIKLLSEPRTELSEETVNAVRKMVQKRISGYPLQYIVGEWDFCKLTFKVGDGVLIPRPDTETLVGLAQEFGARRILDLCAGSGCVGIAAAKITGGNAVCVEKSAEAFGYLAENIQALGCSDTVTPVEGDIFDPEIIERLGGGYDLILSNPPYLTDEDMESLQTEVTFEPKIALYGGADGLDFYRKILKLYPEKLTSGGVIGFEVGYRQAEAVKELFRENGPEPLSKTDFNGIERVIYAFRS